MLRWTTISSTWMKPTSRVHSVSRMTTTGVSGLRMARAWSSYPIVHSQTSQQASPSIQFHPDPRLLRTPSTMPRRYTVQRPGGPQSHQPEATLPPFPPMPDMSTRPEGDFQRVVVDALTPSRLEYRDVAVWAGGVCEPAHHQQQDHHASAEATPRRPPTRLLMRTSPHISIPIYLYFLLFSYF